MVILVVMVSLSVEMAEMLSVPSLPLVALELPLVVAVEVV